MIFFAHVFESDIVSLSLSGPFFLSLSLCPPNTHTATEPAKGEPGGGEPPFARPDPDPDAAEPDAAGTDHGEQGPVPRGAKTIHVCTYISTHFPHDTA